MSFSDPLPFTIGGATKNLVRVDSSRYASEYFLAEAGVTHRALIRSTNLKAEADGRYRVRHNVSLRTTVAATSTTPELIRQSSHTIEHYFGDDVTAFDDQAIAIAALITAGNVVKLNNMES